MSGKNEITLTAKQSWTANIKNVAHREADDRGKQNHVEEAAVPV